MSIAQIATIAIVLLAVTTLACAVWIEDDGRLAAVALYRRALKQDAATDWNRNGPYQGHIMRG